MALSVHAVIAGIYAEIATVSTIVSRAAILATYIPSNSTWNSAINSPFSSPGTRACYYPSRAASEARDTATDSTGHSTTRCTVNTPPLIAALVQFEPS